MTGPDDPATPDHAMPPDDAVIGRLRKLAAAERTGALHVSGDQGGVVFLVEGQIGHVESARTPTIESLLLPGRREGIRAAAEQAVRGGSIEPLRLEIVARTACVDAALALLVPAAASERPTRFRANQRHWFGSPWPMGIDPMLAEIRTRQAVLARLAANVTPDQPLGRAAHIPGGRVWLSSDQWEIVRHTNGSRSPRVLAGLLCRGVFATTVAAGQLVSLGVLRRGEDAHPRTVTPPVARSTATAPPLSFLRAVLPQDHDPFEEPHQASDANDGGAPQ